MNNRVTVFLASYFDIIFAINELTHPGEKRLIETCLCKCKILPKNFKENIDNLLGNINKGKKIIELVDKIIFELKEVINI